MKKVHLVIFGGDSFEHEISIISAIQAMKQYRDCIAVYIDPLGVWYAGDNLKELSSYQNGTYKKNKQVSILPNSQYLYRKKGKKLKAIAYIEDVLCVFHGDKMEGGGMASLFEQNGIPYSSSPMLGSAIVQSKTLSEYILRGLDVPRLPFIVIKKEEYFLDSKSMKTIVKEEVQYPLILKPSNLGSSIGIEVIHDESKLDEGMSNAFQFDEEVLVQSYLPHMTELNIALYSYQGELQLSNIEQPLKHEEILSFADKYQQGDKEGLSSLTRIMNPLIDKEVEEKVKNTAKKVYTALSLSGIVRFDFMLDNTTNSLYLNEVNNIPGSLAFYLFDLPYEQLLRRVMIEAHKKKEKKIEKKLSFCVLNKFTSSKLGKLQK